MLVRSVAAACIKLRKRDKILDMLFFLLSVFFLSNSDTLQTQPDRLAEHGVRLSAQGSETDHCCSADDQ